MANNAAVSVTRSNAFDLFRAGKIDAAALEAAITGKTFAAEPKEWKGNPMVEFTGPFRPKSVSAKLVMLILDNAAMAKDAAVKAQALCK